MTLLAVAFGWCAAAVALAAAAVVYAALRVLKDENG